MDIFCCKIRSFNDKIKRCGFRKWFRNNKPIFGGLIETHVSSVKAPAIISRAFPGWHYDCNYEFSDLGKIWLLWHPTVCVSVLHKLLQSITYSVRLLFISTSLVVTLVYGSTCRKIRRELWAELCFLSYTAPVRGSPWVVLGDFNQVLSASEHSTADPFSSSRGMREFFNCIDSASLSDLPFCGNPFTWSNKQGATVVSKKLDRVLVNDNWLQVFPNSLAVFGDPGISDHSPCCVFIDSAKPKEKRPFKFFTLLNNHPDFEVLIKECWESLQFDGTSMLNVSKKLKFLKSIIRTFSRENYSELEKRVAEAFEELISFQRVLLSYLTSQAAINEKDAHLKWSALAKAEESFLYQRSRVNWLDKGDCGSAFFHRSIRSRLTQNQVLFLLDENDCVIDTKEGIMQHTLHFYEDLLGGSVTTLDVSPDEIAQLIPYRCSSSVSDTLAALFSRLDIQKAFFLLPKNKSPGPDGYPAEFFTAHWSTVGSKVTDAVEEFFQFGRLLQQWNATILTLIPKKKSAVKIIDFRPISCCNTTYKVIVKLLANRLKQVLPNVISNMQSAFIPGRLLVENVLMASELVN